MGRTGPEGAEEKSVAEMARMCAKMPTAMSRTGPKGAKEGTVAEMARMCANVRKNAY